MCCIYDLVYSLETHIKHLHLEASKGYKTQHTVPSTLGRRAAAAKPSLNVIIYKLFKVECCYGILGNVVLNKRCV